jgi:H+/Cl- antiporter ClcA
MRQRSGMVQRSFFDECLASIFVAIVMWGIGVLGLLLVVAEGNAIVASGMERKYLLLAAPFFLGIMSYFLVRWSDGYKGPSELIVLLKQKSSDFPGWFKATITWIIACIELGSGLSPKGFEGPYIAAAGGLGGLLSTKLHFDANARRRLARCGLGVAFATLFRTPLGGFLCMFEFGNYTKGKPNQFEKEDAIKQFILGMIATSVGFFLTWVTEQPRPFAILSTPAPITWSSLMSLSAVGVVCGLIALLYIMTIHTSKNIFGFLEKDMHVASIVIPILGATVSTGLGAFFPIILGSNELSRALAQAPAIPLVLLGAIIAKVIATSSADGSKCAGGTVGPAILLGGLIGILVGGGNPLYAAAGAAALTGSAAGLPLTMFVTSVTWLGFTPVAWLILLPMMISQGICLVRGAELYPYVPDIGMAEQLSYQTLEKIGLPSAQARNRVDDSTQQQQVRKRQKALKGT